MKSNIKVLLNKIIELLISCNESVWSMLREENNALNKLQDELYSLAKAEIPTRHI